MSSHVTDLVKNAYTRHIVIPAFNVPYLPMVAPIIDALHDTRTFALVAVARLEWTKFEAGGLREVFEEYKRHADSDHTGLHLDHVPVIDEDNKHVDYLPIIREALELGYDSVMVDGSRLSLDENIAVTRRVVEEAHARGIPVEAELGSVLGHEEGPLPPYEELFRSGEGFTSEDDAERFVRETGVDWLSVAVGSVHGAISRAHRDEAKPAARLNIERLRSINDRIKIPIVLHGGSGIPMSYVREGIEHGIAKINIGTAIRQPYERTRSESVEAAQQAVYNEVIRIVTDELEVSGSVDVLASPE